MPRTLFSRLLAGLLALTAGFGVPAAAVAHGYAHHREAAAEHRHHGHHGDADADSPASPAEHEDVGIAVGEPPAEDVGGHAHPRLDSALSVRLEWPAFAVAAVLRVALAVEYRAIAPPSLVAEREGRPGDLAHAPPPPSRAPPPRFG